MDGWITSTDLYRSILEGQPYRVRGLVAFGANLLLSHADAGRGANALRDLEFHVQTDLYLTPTASYADIVLPIASGWEREGLRVALPSIRLLANTSSFGPRSLHLAVKLGLTLT